MDLKKSIEIALAQKGRKKKELAEGLGITPVCLSKILSKNHCTQRMLEATASYFEIPVSKLVALGED